MENSEATDFNDFQSFKWRSTLPKEIIVGFLRGLYEIQVVDSYALNWIPYYGGTIQSAFPLYGSRKKTRR